MNKTYLLAVAAALLAAPLAFAHPYDPAGHPTGMIGLPKHWCEDADDVKIHEYGPPALGAIILLGLDGSIPPCPYGDTTWDGHWEWAAGGAILIAGPEAIACYGAYPDYTPGSEIWVYDEILTPLGSGVSFEVGVDTTPAPCGDGLIDLSIQCVDYCAPGFPPGIDGVYYVFVSGTTGHVYH